MGVKNTSILFMHVEGRVSINEPDEHIRLTTASLHATHHRRRSSRSGILERSGGDASEALDFESIGTMPVKTLQTFDKASNRLAQILHH